MTYIAIQILRKIDNNNFTTNLVNLYKIIVPIIKPTLKMNMILKDGTVFYIDSIIQDIKKNRILLLQYVDLLDRLFYDVNFLPKYLKKLTTDEGWIISNKFDNSLL